MKNVKGILKKYLNPKLTKEAFEELPKDMRHKAMRQGILATENIMYDQALTQ